VRGKTEGVREEDGGGETDEVCLCLVVTQSLSLLLIPVECVVPT
jgi:hypothetical protein